MGRATGNCKINLTRTLRDIEEMFMIKCKGRRQLFKLKTHKFKCSMLIPKS